MYESWSDKGTFRARFQEQARAADGKNAEYAFELA
jgi:hypothetical protein